MFEEEIAGLLDDILHADKRRLVLLKRLLQRFDGLLDGLAVLACLPLLGFGTNEAIGEDGLNQLKDPFALGLPTHDAASRLRLTAPLPVPVRVR